MVSTKFLFESMNPLKNEGRYILKSDEYNPIAETFLLSGNNFLVFNADLVKALLRKASKEEVSSTLNRNTLTGEINKIKPISVERIEKAINEINKNVKTENIILLGGDVRKNIPLLTMKERYTSERGSEADRKLLHISLDKLEGEREESNQSVSVQGKIHIADYDFDGLYIYNHVNSLIDSERDLMKKPIDSKANTKRADRVMLSGDVYVTDELSIADRVMLSGDVYVSDDLNVAEFMDKKDNFVEIEKSVFYALPDYINKMTIERNTKRGSFYEVNEVRKENTLGRATRYYIAKKTITEKPSIWGMLLNKEDIDILTRVIIGLNLSEKRTVPIPMRLVKILSSYREIPLHEMVIVEEDKRAIVDRIKDTRTIRNQKNGLIEHKRDLDLEMSISAFLDKFNDVQLPEEQKRGKKVEYNGRMYDDSSIAIIENIPHSGNLLDEQLISTKILESGEIYNKNLLSTKILKDGKVFDEQFTSEGFKTFNSILDKTIKLANDIIKEGSINDSGMTGIEDEQLMTGSIMDTFLSADFGRVAKMIFSYFADKNVVAKEFSILEPEKIAEKLISQAKISENTEVAEKISENLGVLSKILEVEPNALYSVLDSKSLEFLKIDRPAEMLEDPEGERVNLHDATLNIFGGDGGNGVEKVPKESKIENKDPIYPPAIGVESPPELWEDADIHDPEDDLNESDPSMDKQTPIRWYDNPKTPVQNILEMMVEVKNRNQGLNVPADKTADMINHILQNWTKYNVNKNPEEHKTIADFIQKLMDSTLNDVCQLKERTIDDSVVDYKKDFQEEGSWMDKEWVGSDKPPEGEGVGRWINVDLTKPSGATAEQLDATFAKNGGYLAGLGQACIDAEQKYGVNAYYIASHACWESTWGKSQIARDKNNLFGYGAYDWSPYESAWTFPSKSACIDKVMSNVARDYLDPNGRYYGGSPTLKGMNKRYATDMNWANGIATLMKQFAGGKNPPDGLLNGYTAQPYSAWYRYKEPDDEVALEKQYDPETDDPNYALHSPNNMAVEEKSSVSIRKNSKLSGKIKYRAKVNGVVTDPQIVTRFVDNFSRTDFGTGYAVNPASWAYNDPSKGWRIENGKAKANSSSYLTGYFTSKYECAIKARCRIKKYPADGNIMCNGQNNLIYDNSFLGYSGNDGHFHNNDNDAELRANGWYEWIGWGGQVIATGSVEAGQVANAEWTITLNVGKMGGYIDFRYLIWCDESDSGVNFSVESAENSYSLNSKGYGNGYPFTGEFVEQNIRNETLNLYPGENKIKVSIHNSGVSALLLDEVKAYELGYTETFPNGTTYYNSSIRAGMFPEGQLDLGGGSPNYETYTKGYVNPESDSETFDVIIPSFQPSAPGVETRHDFYFSFFQDNPRFMDYCTIDDLTIIETRTSTGGTSFLNFYIDGQLKQETYYTGKRWNHYEFDVMEGSHEYKWEFVQKDTALSDYALIDDIKIINWQVKTEQYWDCPPDTGEELIDKVIDSLKDKVKPQEPKHPDAGNIWLMT